MSAHLAAEPFPDLGAEDLLYAYAALVGRLSALVPAAVYADSVIVARKAAADRKSSPAGRIGTERIDTGF